MRVGIAITIILLSIQIVSADTLNLTADTTTISTADIPGVNKSTITVNATNNSGQPLKDRVVNFSITLGVGDLSLTTAITDTNGQATVTLHSDIAGNATVTASTFNDSSESEIEGNITIHIMDEPFVSVITTIEPDPVEPGGIINVTTVISAQGNITEKPEINIYIGNNTTIGEWFTNVTYINNSANVTYFNCTCSDCSEGNYENEYSSNPNITYTENRTILTWDVGNRPDPDYAMMVGKYWKVVYQLKIDDKSATVVPVILQPSNISYKGPAGIVNVTIPEVTVDVKDADESSEPAANLELSATPEDNGPPNRPSAKPETIQEYAYKLTAHLTDENETSVAWGTLVEFRVTSGTLYNNTDSNASGRFNETTKNSGNAIVRLCSDAPGTITVWASHTTENGMHCNDSIIVVFHSLDAPPMIPPAPQPRGRITLE